MINAPRHQLFRRCVYMSGCRTEHPATDAPLEQMCNAARCARRDEPGTSALQPAAVRMCSVPTHNRSWTVSKKVLSLLGRGKNHIAPKVFFPFQTIPFFLFPYDLSDFSHRVAQGHANATSRSQPRHDRQSAVRGGGLGGGDLGGGGSARPSSAAAWGAAAAAIQHRCV